MKIRMVARPVTADAERDDFNPDDLPTGFEGVGVIEGEWTMDGRYIEMGALEHRDLPLPLVHGEHGGTDVAGLVTEIERVETGESAEWRISGTFDHDVYVGRLAAHQLSEGTMRWVSVDLEVDEVEWEETEEDFRVRVLHGRIAAFTQVPIPAFDRAVIGPVGAAVTASAPNRPPAEWFEDPELDGPSRLVVTEEGRVFGHVALWETCHLGQQEACVTPPKGCTYSLFNHGTITTVEGTEVRVGQLTIGVNHPSLGLGREAARAHYAGGPGAVQWADVHAGEDDYGVWVAGAVRPDVDEMTIRRARALGLSGDWRPYKDGLELVAVLSVPVPAFPIAASAHARVRVRGEETLALVASVPPLGSETCVDTADLQRRLESVELQLLTQRVGLD